MNESILESIKKMLDLSETETFDTDLKVFINSALDDLRDNGVGNHGVYIDTGDEAWEDFIPNYDGLANVKSFVLCSVKPLIDGTISNAYSAILEKEKEKALWRCKQSYIPSGKDTIIINGESYAQW